MSKQNATEIEEMSTIELTARLLIQEKRIEALEKRQLVTDQAIMDIVTLVRSMEKNSTQAVLAAISNIFHGVAHQFDAQLEQPAGHEEHPHAMPEYVFVPVDPVEQPNHIKVVKTETGYNLYRSMEPDVLVPAENTTLFLDQLNDMTDFAIGETRYFTIVAK